MHVWFCRIRFCFISTKLTDWLSLQSNDLFVDWETELPWWFISSMLTSCCVVALLKQRVMVLYQWRKATAWLSLSGIMETGGSKSETSPAALDSFPVPMSNVSFPSDHKSVTQSSRGLLVDVMDCHSNDDDTLPRCSSRDQSSGYTVSACQRHSR